MEMKQLVKEIEQRFNTSELKTVCFDAGIPTENLSWNNKPSLIIEMVQYCQRRGGNHLTALFAALHDANPTFVVVGGTVEIVEVEPEVEPVRVDGGIVDPDAEEREALLDALRKSPRIDATLKWALIYIVGRL